MTLEKVPTVVQLALTGMVVLAGTVALVFNKEPVISEGEVNLASRVPTGLGKFIADDDEGTELERGIFDDVVL